jgi:hypothetical protein
MNRIILATAFVLVAQVSLMAQGAATFHVFPQIADGNVSDGTYYQTYVLLTSVSAQPATCTLRFYGVPISRLDATPTGVLGGLGASAVLATTGNLGPLATGYATLSCDRNVTAFAAYVNRSPAGAANSGASVFSSPQTMRAQLFVFNSRSPDNRTAFALANDTDSAAQYRLTVIDPPTGQTIASTTISLPARSNLPRFLDQIVPLPQNFAGTVVITSVTGSAFSVVGLVFSGSTFLSMPATIY